MSLFIFKFVHRRSGEKSIVIINASDEIEAENKEFIKQEFPYNEFALLSYTPLTFEDINKYLLEEKGYFVQPITKEF